MNKDTVAGKMKEIGGKVRSAVGHAAGDTEGEARGKIDQVAGNVQKNIGKIKDNIS